MEPGQKGVFFKGLEGFTHFLFGGNVGVAEKLRDKLEEQFPGIRIVGTYTPPFRPLNENEETKLKELVDRLKPDLFWVGLSTPKQERFMAEYIKKLDAKVMLGVGAAFDIHAGLIKDAPNLFKRTVHAMVLPSVQGTKAALAQVPL